MSEQDLLAQVRQKAQVWLGEGYDEATRQEVQALLDNEDTTALVEAFYRELEFGTGGLRGIMGVGCNRMNKYTVGAATQGLANYLKKEFAHLPQIAVVIGYDCRNNSPYFSRIAAEIFTANGIKVYLFEELRPTPEISYAIRTLNCQSGVMITASHNPKEYNGYKAYWEDGSQVLMPHDQNIINEVAKITDVKDINFEGNEDLIVMLGEEMDNEFTEMVKGLCLEPESVKRHKDLKILYTPIHGTGVVMVPRALRAIGFENIINVPEQDVVSGDFPTVYSPNPEDPAALKLALARAEETKADIILASDPDADRLAAGVRDDEGNMVLLNGNDICALLTYFTIAQRRDLGILKAEDYVVKTIVTTELIAEIAKKNNVKMFDSYTGFKWIAGIIRENEDKLNYIGGGEESFGFLREASIRDKSSVSGCTMFCELAAWTLDRGMTVYQLLQQLYLEYGLYKEQGISIVRKGKSGAEEIQAMMDQFRNNPMTTLGGSKVVTVKDFSTLTSKNLLTGEVSSFEMPAMSNVLQYFTENGDKVSIRPSGTEPKIKFYIGVKGELANAEVLAEAEAQCLERISQIRQELGNI